MSAFAGIVELAPHGLATASAIDASLRANLSRHPGEVVHTRTTAGAVVHYFDLDAWADGPAVQDDGDRFLLVCGDPAYGEASTRQAGIDLFADDFRRDQAAALAATTGTFSLAALADDEATLAADKFGSRPVYWARRGDALCFSTSFRALRGALEDTLTIDARAIRETVVAGQPLGDRTPYAEIRVLRPGQMLRATDGGATVASYHDWARTPALALTRDEALAVVHETFLQGVRRRSYAPTADACLSGGMDSRCVVAGLLEAGRRVNTFNSSYPGSADHVLGEEIARHFGTVHRTDLRDPIASLRYTLETFASYARRARHAFPRTDGRPDTAGRLLWTGDGGSVIMGHVYLTGDQVQAFAASPVDRAAVRARFRSRGNRVVRGSRTARFQAEAHAAIAEEIDAIACPAADRRLYLYFLLNNQARHVYWNHEQLDQNRVELVTPFFNATLVETILGLPVAWFLRHDFYNDWIGRFRVGADAVPWQVYPGHLPGPHPPRQDLRLQWRDDWHERRALSRIYRDLARGVLRHRGRFSREVLDYRWLALYHATLCLGTARFGWEIRTANRLSAELDRQF